MTSLKDHSASTQNEPGSDRIVISVDAMGGDRGPEAVVSGIARSAAKNPTLDFILHGPKKKLKKLVKKKAALKGRCQIRDAQGVVNMEDKPSQVMRNGKGTSMWSALESVKNQEATVAVSCGNTGALMALSMIRLRKLPGINRPAIAILWPSRNPQGFNVMLDVGADIRADAKDLLQYALMGTSYARNGLDLERPRVGLLNVGTEENKGFPELKAAYDLIAANEERANYEFVGYVEGSDIPGKRCDVIVTDGFTGNIALKTGEGTAKLIGDQLRNAFTYSFLSRIAAMFVVSPMKRFQKKIDPRRVNGGVFLGLNGTVVKSHGSADAMGVSSAVKLAFELANAGFGDRLAARVASAAELAQNDAAEQDRDAEDKSKT